MGLARIIAAPATLWLLDEPTVSLDEQSVAILIEVVDEHRAEGGMVMAATHVDIGLAAAAVLNLSENGAATGARAGARAGGRA